MGFWFHLINCMFVPRTFCLWYIYFFLPVFVTTKIDIYFSIYIMNMKPQSHFCLLLLECYLIFTWLKKVFRTRKNKIETIALNFVFEVIITHLGNQAFRFGVMYLSNNWNCQSFGTTSPFLGHKIFFFYIEWKQNKQKLALRLNLPNRNYKRNSFTRLITVLCYNVSESIGHAAGRPGLINRLSTSCLIGLIKLYLFFIRYNVIAQFSKTFLSDPPASIYLLLAYSSMLYL